MHQPLILWPWNIPKKFTGQSTVYENPSGHYLGGYLPSGQLGTREDRQKITYGIFRTFKRGSSPARNGFARKSNHNQERELP